MYPNISMKNLVEVKIYYLLSRQLPSSNSLLVFLNVCQEPVKINTHRL